MITHKKREDNYTKATNDIVSRKELRRAFRGWTIAVAISFLLLAAGGLWTVNSLVSKSKHDIINNAVSICERNLPVRVATNKNSKANKVLALNTAHFLMTIQKDFNLLHKQKKRYTNSY